MSEATEAVNAVVRDEWSRIVGAVVRASGQVQLAEDVAQDAVAAALVSWERDGVPDKPAAWLTAVARRRAIDRLRKVKTHLDKAPALQAMARLGQAPGPLPGETPDYPDDRLRLLFTCCHPALAAESRVPLTLRVVCGLHIDEIARAFLTKRPAVQQRIVRAKKKIAAAGIPWRVPDPEDWPERLPSVLATIYLVFNEGYAASSGAEHVRGKLCGEAIWLGRTLASILPDEPEVLGLLGLMLLHDSRRSARVGSDGALVLLDDQDRTAWDQDAIAQGLALLDRALALRRPGPYQIQAAVAALHAQAATPEDTDWNQIAALYGGLLQHHPTPVVALNRAVAVAMAQGAEAGLALLDDEALSSALASYPLYHAARADFYRRSGQINQATSALEAALALTMNEIERDFLRRRLDQLREE